MIFWLNLDMRLNILKKRILIDGDIIAYRASSSVQRDIDWGDGLWTCHAFLSDAKEQFYNLSEDILNREVFGDDEYEIIFAFSDSHNFRKDLCDGYKANRANKRKPTCYNALVDYIKSEHHTVQLKNLEGDDVLGIYATMDGYDSIIVSLDKDMKTIPGKFYNFGTDELITVTKDQAKYNHMYQTLIGDVADGYPGCPKYGPVKAKKLLDSLTPDKYWEGVVKAFESQGLTEADALLQARLSYILQDGDYDTETHEVKLWLP